MSELALAGLFGNLKQENKRKCTPHTPINYRFMSQDNNAKAE